LISSRRAKHPGTSRTNEVNLASTRHTEAHELLWTSCCNRRMRSAANGTAFTDELSERNTKFILCNSFFAASPGRAFPTDLRPRGSARGPRRYHHPHPAIEIVPASFRTAHAYLRAEDQLPVDKTMHPAWTESEIRSVVGLFELLDRWNSSSNDQTSNLTSWIFRFSVNLKCEWTCPIKHPGVPDDRSRYLQARIQP
jgi:hypothetical protein